MKIGADSNGCMNDEENMGRTQMQKHGTRYMKILKTKMCHNNVAVFVMLVISSR